MNNNPQKLMQFNREVEILRKKYEDEPDKFLEKLEDSRCKEVKKMLFDEFLRDTNNAKIGVKSLNNYFAAKK